MSVQLDLFEGKILTTEQELEIQSYIERCDKEVIRKQNENRSTMLLLDKAGFKQGIDYINNFEISERTYDHEFGYSYNNTQWEAEVSVMRSSGGCYILYDTLQNGKIEMSKSGVYREGDKLQCTSITSQYRYYKPSSLLSKLKEHNEKIQYQFEVNNKKQSVIEYTVEKYKKLYPEAKIFIGTDYYKDFKNYTEFKTVKVEFKSGSSVTFKLGYENDRETLHKKHDVQPMTTEQLLEMFNNQKIK
jgi:hypothetical protein